MTHPRLQRSTLAMFAVSVPLVLLFVYVVLRSGPMAPVEVTTITVESRSIAPALSGIGTVQARYTYKIGPTFAGRVHRLYVQVGDSVKAGQMLGQMEPVDLDERMGAQQAAIQSAQAVQQQAQAKQVYAKSQAHRYDQLLAARMISEETAAARQQELAVANAGLNAANEDIRRMRADHGALRAQRDNLDLIAPADGLVVARNAEPGTTLVAGQSVIELIDPARLWVDTRFDQISATGLEAGRPTHIRLRSSRDYAVNGNVLRIEPRADAVTEETLAKITFATLPSPLPPLGEMAEVTVQLAALPAARTIPNAAIRTVDGQRGVWRLASDEIVFTPVTLGRADLDGNVQINKGLKVGDRIVLYSDKTLTARSRVHIVGRIAKPSP